MYIVLQYVLSPFHDIPDVVSAVVGCSSQKCASVTLYQRKTYASRSPCR